MFGAVPQGLEAKEKERVWVRNQNAGELDDTKLVDGATGERNIFKKRGNNNPMFGNIQTHPKRALKLPAVHVPLTVMHTVYATH